MNDNVDVATEAELPPAPENVVELRPKSIKDKMAKKKSDKADKARKQRRDYLLKSGVDEKVVDQVMEHEEYTKLPIDQKLMRLEAAIAHTQRVYNTSLQQLAAEMVAIRQNQEILADTLDINFRAWEAIMVTTGVTAETQREVVERVTKEFYADKQKSVDAAVEATRVKTKDEVEKETMETELKSASESPTIVQS